MEAYTVCNCPSTEVARTNRAILNSRDSFAQFEHIAVRYPKKTEAFVFSVKSDPGVAQGQIAFNLSGRKWASLQTGSKVEAAPYKFEPQQCLNAITFQTDFANVKTAPTDMDYNTEDMAKQFSQQFFNQAFTVGQLFGFIYNINNRNVVLELKVKELEAVDIESVGKSNVEIGLTTGNTVVIFERAEGSEIKLVGGFTGQVSAPKIFSQNWDFESMGVGGLSEQFNKMFRRAFSSRLLPPQFAESLGVEHVRGMLLYGPPGTGKTLIARQIGKMLLAREPKIVNGPEVLNKYVGESEANIRKLFQEAEEEQKKAGMNSGLHMIIFDEIDAICKSRGQSASSAGVGDNVVNQLLSKIDGVDSLNNVLLVGMTNRKDLIDDALLRPGRLELQIEIGLPNKQGRLEIFKIHTKKMQEKGALDSSVNLDELAEMAKNYTGAEIAGLIKAARSLAINRVVKADSGAAVDMDALNSIKVTRDDFMYAMEHDVKPALGASEDQLKRLARPMIQWDPIIGTIQTSMTQIIEGITAVEGRDNLPRFVLLCGDEDSGLTTLAANMAAESKFPFIRIYEARTTADLSESGKVQYMKKLFDDASRSELSCVVIDGLEIILDYCHIGPRYSNTSRNVLISNRNLTLPGHNRMLVICVCNDKKSLEDMNIDRKFNDIIMVPSLTNSYQVKTVMVESGCSTFTTEQTRELLAELDSPEHTLKIGIKKLEHFLKISENDDPSQRVEKFMERLRLFKLFVRKRKDFYP